MLPTYPTASLLQLAASHVLRRLGHDLRQKLAEQSHRLLQLTAQLEDCDRFVCEAARLKQLRHAAEQLTDVDAESVHRSRLQRGVGK